MRNSFIAKKDLDSEMSVVRNEYEMGENRPSSVLMKRMQSMMYDWHNYARALLATEAILSTFVSKTFRLSIIAITVRTTLF